MRWFSTNPVFQNASAQEAWIIIGDRGGPGFGFKVLNSDLLAWNSDSTGNVTTTTVVSGFSAGYAPRLWAGLASPDIAVFFVNGNKVAEHTTNLPVSGDSVNNRFFDIDFTNTEAVDKVIEWAKWDYQELPH